MIQENVFRGIILLEQEDVSEKSNREKSLLMEKFGAIKSADDFSTAVKLRNKLAHHYPEERKEQIDKINLLAKETKFIIELFDHLVEYATKKDFIPIDNKFGENLVRIKGYKNPLNQPTIESVREFVGRNSLNSTP